jgi:hypothetical protein
VCLAVFFWSGKLRRSAVLVCVCGGGGKCGGIGVSKIGTCVIVCVCVWSSGRRLKHQERLRERESVKGRRETSINVREDWHISFSVRRKVEGVGMGEVEKQKAKSQKQLFDFSLPFPHAQVDGVDSARRSGLYRRPRGCTRVLCSFSKHTHTHTKRNSEEARLMCACVHARCPVDHTCAAELAMHGPP